MKPNLQKLFYETPNINPHQVSQVLEDIFFRVISEPRNELLFNFQFLCADESKVRLIVRFGWSERSNRWYFEALPGDKNVNPSL
jgi:hypothetical protein